MNRCVTDDAWFNGEPAVDEDFLCDTHGCRLSIGEGRLFCPECVAVEKEKDRAYYMVMDQYRQDRDPNIDALGWPVDPSAGCKLVNRGGVIGFECTMPWWA